jgi:cell division protein ZapA (FtsZ GTPase activity inhibitor)
MKKLSIKITIAGRTYPLMVNPNEEETIRKAAKSVDEKVREYEQSYAVKDKQDLIAMCALEFTTELFKTQEKPSVEDEGLMGRLLEIENLIDRSI